MVRRSTTDLWRDGEVIQIEGRSDRVVRLSGFRYDAKAVIRCPVCHSIGTPWLGWFHCDSCVAFAWIETGEVFIPLAKTHFPRLYRGGIQETT